MPLSQAILQLQESGDLLMLKDRWWKQKKGGGQCVEDTKKGSGTVMPLKIDNVGGVFVVLLGGLSFSLFVVILEFLWRARTSLKQVRHRFSEFIVVSLLTHLLLISL